MMSNNQELTDSLSKVLASSYALYLKTQNFHWNVTGPNFKALHSLFEEQYTELFNAIDEIAERIRTLGAYAPGSFSAYSNLSSIKDAVEILDASTMVKNLASDQITILKDIQATLDLAKNASDEATMGILVERISVHEKNLWMLNSST